MAEADYLASSGQSYYLIIVKSDKLLKRKIFLYGMKESFKHSVKKTTQVVAQSYRSLINWLAGGEIKEQEREIESLRLTKQTLEEELESQVKEIISLKTGSDEYQELAEIYSEENKELTDTIEGLKEELSQSQATIKRLSLKNPALSENDIEELKSLTSRVGSDHTILVLLNQFLPEECSLKPEEKIRTNILQTPHDRSKGLGRFVEKLSNIEYITNISYRGNRGHNKTTKIKQIRKTGLVTINYSDNGYGAILSVKTTAKNIPQTVFIAEYIKKKLKID